jgi:hypothetical protein
MRASSILFLLLQHDVFELKRPALSPPGAEIVQHLTGFCERVLDFGPVRLVS